MKPEKIYLTLDRLEWLLNLQKKEVIERLLSNTYLYNPETTACSLVPLNIDKEKFKEQGMKAEFPEDFKTLKEYLTP